MTFKTTVLCGSLFFALCVAVGCSDYADQCENVSQCEPGSTGAAGGTGGASGGSSGQGGSSGSAGTSSGGDGGTAGSSGAGGEAGSGGSCDTTKSPTEESCLVSSEYAIFVAPNGDDDAAGSKASPVATLTKAVELAADDKIVIVCNAEYDEHVEITSGVRVYGGFDCDDWTVDAGAPLFKPSDAGPALKIDAAEDAIVIEKVAFEVTDATLAGGSAVTAIVNASPSVTLRGVTLKAGKGLAGDDGTLTEFEFKAQAELDGNPEEPVTMGGAFKICACQTGLESGGGLGGGPSPTGQDGAPGSPDHGGGAGGNRTQACNSGGGGQNGDDAPGKPPANGATTFGTASSSGWLPTSGENGATGAPGQGGGGGASLNSSGHGGGGGCGGCGGNGGTGGKGGGGSIALLLIDSPITLETSTLTTSDAGDGGDGASGQPGQQDVGAGGNSISTLNSCAGGNGGKGGDGGAGGGGAGGISVGIVWTGDTEPVVSEDTIVMLGEPGLPGDGGAGDNDGVAGVAQDVLEL